MEEPAKRYDWIIHGGRVIDPAQGIDAVRDVAIRDGRIAAVGNDLGTASAAMCYDARGKVVTPGLVDLHVHAYHRVTPLGIDVDEHCLKRGVTTVVDAGSAGHATFPGFLEYGVRRFRTRVVAFLNISSIGLTVSGLGGDSAATGELDLLKFADIDACVRCIEAHRDILVGVKVRLSRSIGDEGRNEAAALARAQQAASEVSLPLMAHHAMSAVPLETCPGNMRAGDIYTHCFHGFESTIIDVDRRRVHDVVRRARDRGVLMDVGSGQGSFSWTVAEMALGEGFNPDTISTDLHAGTIHGPTYDLPTVMTRFLHLGMPLPEIVARTTIAPARAVGLDACAGTLRVGRDADIAVFSLVDTEVHLEDCQAQTRKIRQRIVPEAVWRAGDRHVTSLPEPWPNPEAIRRQRVWWDRLVVRDDVAPQV